MGLNIGANLPAEVLTGITKEEMLGKSISLFFTEEELKRTPWRYDLLKQGLIVRNERLLTRKDSSTVQIEMNTRMMPDGNYQTFIRDISERIRIEDEMQKNRKLESIGILAGGIAHDFNNILTAILGNISLLKYDILPTDNKYQLLTEAEKATLRAKDLTKQLLTFSKGGEPIRENTIINDIIMDSADFVLRGSKTKCNYDFPEELWMVYIDKGQISQVVQNMIINADQAMPDGGTIQIKARNFNYQYNDIPGLKNGTYLKISISDNGIGIPSKFIKKIFDPYFSTKRQGSGLGLSICYSIIRKHDGLITVSSELGEGTVFEIYLPAVQTESAVTHHSETAHQHEKSLKNKKILFMDDELMLRNLVTNILKTFGYEIVVAGDGQEALDLYNLAKKEENPFDLIIVDLTVPGGMGGKETVKIIRQTDKAIKAIVSSGYSNDPIMSEYKSFEFDGVISKPFKVDNMVQEVKRVLES